MLNETLHRRLAALHGHPGWLWEISLIEVDGKFVELVGDLGLGSMPSCGEDGLKAGVAGELKGGKFVATSFQCAED